MLKHLKLVLVTVASFSCMVNVSNAQVVGGFFPNWYASSSINTIQWPKLTDLFYAFAQPTNTGGYTLTNENWLTTLVNNGKANNVRIHLSFGGAAQGSTGWSGCISTATNRSNFANTCKNLVTTYDLNGINLDWEYPSATEAANFADLAIKIRAALDQAEVTLGHKVYLTCAVSALIWNNDGINSNFLSVMDYVMPMAFDDGSCSYCGGPNHSSLTMAQNAFLHWTTGIPNSGKPGKGVAPNKIVISIPFYDNTGTAYQSFSNSNPAAYFSDADGYYGGYYYNSDPLIKAKADYLMPKGVAGLWTWELVQDRTDQYSLLGSMYSNVMSYSCALPTPNLGSDQSICGQSSITLNSNLTTATVRTFTWKKDGAVVVNASTTATTYAISLGGTYRVEVTEGTCMKFDEVVVSSTLSPVVLGGPYTLCNPPTVTLNSGSDANGKTFVWRKDNLVISGATSPTYVASMAGIYNVTVSAIGCSSVSGSTSVSSSLPVAKNDTICSAGTANLISNVASDWYTSSTGGTAVKTNSTTHSPSISTSTIFYIQPSGAASTSNTTMRSAFQNDGWQQNPNVYATKFDVLASISLDAVTVNIAGGDITLNVVASNGTTVVASKSFAALSAGLNTLNLGFSLSPGTYYINTVGSVSTTLVDLTPAANYSIPNIITVYGEAFWDWSVPYGDGYVLSGDYGNYINLKVSSGYSCGRVPVYAVVNANNPKCVSNPPISNFTANKTTACTNEQITFTDASTGGTPTSWSWDFGAGATPPTATGKGPHVVTYSTTGSKTISLIASNQFGSNKNTKTNFVSITGAAGAAGTISGSTSVCAGSSQTYSILAVTGANNYTWTVPAGATITAGQGTTSINVNFTNASSGNLSVTPSNGCGNGTATTVAITVNPLPNASGNISGQTSVCANQTGLNYSLPSVQNATGYNWTLPTGAKITSGLGTNSITVSFATTPGNITVIPSNSCGNGTSSTLAVGVTNKPGATTIAGRTSVCPNARGIVYSAASASGATSYVWTVPAGATITSGQNTTDITVLFGTSGGAVTVTPTNSCGSGTIASLAVSTSGANLPFAEDFENGFPPQSWSVSNPDANITWASATTGASSTASAFMDYWNYIGTAKKDELVLPIISLVSQSTASLSFFHAYAWRDAPGINNDRGDSLQVLVSTNCGVSWNSVWYKGRTSLSTLNAGAGQNSSFFPSSTQWIKNTISLDAYVGQGSVLIKFVGTGNNGNNLYIDQINITGSTIQAPVANFTQSTNTVCTSQNVTFTDASTNVPTSWSWNFGAGATPSTATGQGPHIVTYATSGSKTISLTVSNSAGSNTKTVSTLVVNTTPSAAGLISGEVNVCTATDYNYSVSTISGASSYNWTVPTGATIKTGQGTNSITVNYTSAIVGTLSVTPSNTCGNGTGSALSVTVITAPTGTGTITGASNVCQNEKNVSFSISGISNATSYAWVVPTGATIVSGLGAATINVNFGSNAGNVSTTPSNSCGNGSTITRAVAITNGAGNAGVITGATTVCANQTAVPYSIASVSGATSYTWTIPTGATIASGNGTNSITINFGTTGGIITVTPISNCGNGLASSTTVNVNSIPAAAASITGNNPICSGSTQTYTTSAVTGSTNYTWTVPTGASILSGQNTTSISVKFGTSTGNITVTPSNTCGNSRSSSTSVTVNSVPNPTGTITGQTVLCQNTTGVAYSVSSVANASTYSWSVPNGATITSGAGTSAIVVTFGNTSGNVNVMASNTCGNASSNSTLQVSVTNGASNAGSITGVTSVCENQTSVSYSIATVLGASSYNWSVPTGATIVSGQNTNAISVNFGSSNGNISVTPTSACGNGNSSSSAIVVNKLPVLTGAISGKTSVCEGSTEQYSLTAAANTTSYNWSVPVGASILLRGSTNNPTIDYTGALSGTLKVTANNGNCVGNSLSANITVNGTPAQPGTFTSSTSSVCPGTNNIAYAVPSVSGATSYIWKYTGTGVTFSGTSNNVTANFASNATSGEIQVSAVGTCGTSSPQTIFVSVGAGLANTDNIVGRSTVCQNQTGNTYSILAVSGVSGYDWTVPTGANVTSGANTNSIVVTFGTSSGTVTVTPKNTCGLGTTKSLSVTVNPKPSAAGIITGNSSICTNQTGEAYSITDVANTTNYTWVVPSGTNIISGQGTIAITVNFGSTVGNITVTPSNSCGNGTSKSLAVSLKPLPSAAGTITGVASVCSNQKAVSYSISTVLNATGYNWTVPNGAKVVSGANTTAISVDFGTSGGNVGVTPVNACGSGSAATKSVMLTPVLSGASTITGPATVCAGQTGASYYIAALSGASYNWSVPTGASITAGATTNSITVTFGTNSGNVSVTPSNSCGTGTVSNYAVNVLAKVTPTVSIKTPFMPTCAGKNTTFTAEPANGGSNPVYSWKVNNNIQTGNNSNTLNTIVKAGDVVNVTLTSNATCASTTIANNSLNITTTTTPPSAPTSFTTSNNVVSSSQANVLYVINTVPNAINYSWSYSGLDATLTNTTFATNSTSVSYGANATSGNLSVVANNACGSSSALSLPITVNGVTGIQDVNFDGFNAYVSENRLYLKLEKPSLISVSISDINGVSVSKMEPVNLSAGIHHFEISNLPTAMYFGTILVDNKPSIFKMVVK